MSARVWICGSGGIAAAGRSPEAIFDAIASGRSAIGPIAAAAGAGWPVDRGGEVADFDPRALVPDRKRHKLLRRTDFLGLHAASSAIRESGLAEFRPGLGPAEGATFDDRTAVYVGSGGGGYQTQYEFLGPLATAAGDARAFGEAATADVTPMWLLQSLPNNVLCHVGIEHGFKGPNACFTTHTVSGLIAAGEALAGLRAGDAERALVVAHDAPIEAESIGHFHRLGLFCKADVLPFDASHDGTLLGEGAAALFLETTASVAARGARPIGELLGAGIACESGGLLPIEEDGDGLGRAIHAALADAALAPADVGMIVAHGNGLPGSDDSEAAALLDVFGGDGPPVTAFKWALGHLMAGSFLEAVLGLVAVRRRLVPGIATLRAPASACRGLSIASAPQAPRSDVVLVVSRGFAGTNAALVLRGLSPEAR